MFRFGEKYDFVQAYNSVNSIYRAQPEVRTMLIWVNLPLLFVGDCYATSLHGPSGKTSV